MVRSKANPLGMLRGLWLYRSFIISSVKREFQKRYAGSALGISWNIVQPLTMILVYTMVFTEIMRTRLPTSDDQFAYSIYLCAGMLPWMLFQEIILRSSNVFIENGNLLKKSSFPRICLPTIVSLSALTHFAIAFILFMLFLFAMERFPGWIVIAALPLLILQLALAVAAGIILGTLNVFFRDIGQITNIVLQFWFWLTPIVYPLSALPSVVQQWLDINPLTPLMKGYQDIFVSYQLPIWSTLLPLAAATLVLMIVGYLMFRGRAPEIVDEL